MKIVLFGGSGLLGKELLKLNPGIIAPMRAEVNIWIEQQVRTYLREIKPDVVINAAAETDNRKIEKHPSAAITANVIGAAHVAMACLDFNIRLVYLSTDYVYKGDRGNYSETDEILPFNLYSWTKLGGECSTRAVKNHLIIRTSFGKDFQYAEAFIDKWASKDYVDRLAPLILEAALSPVTGILNLGTERKTLFMFAKERNEAVKPIKIADAHYSTPRDTSLNLQKWLNYKSSDSIAKPHTNCRVCNSPKLVKYLDLGLMPLANNLEFSPQGAKDKERFPLQIMFCEECALSQLSVVIDPEKMFSYYTYRSSVNRGYVEHCHRMAAEFSADDTIKFDSFVIDIAGNDGALLRSFRDIVDVRVLNVDPAANLTAIAEASGIESYTDFFGMPAAQSIERKYGKADLITATNVFAHVDDIRSFLGAAKLLLQDHGVLCLEFPYLVDFIENLEFDTTYFEHLSYMSLLPLDRLCKTVGLEVFNVSKQSIHGGTIRVKIGLPGKHKITGVNKMLEYEKSNGFDKLETYLNWSTRVNELVDDFGKRLLQLKRDGKKIAAFAASAKGNTLLNRAGINTDLINYIVDETPEKIGKFSPGTGIPIVGKNTLIKSPPDYLVILSWNFKDEIMAKVKEFYTGKFIIPIPAFEIRPAD